MKRTLFLLLAASCTTALAAPAPTIGETTGTAPLRPVSACVDVTRVTEWYAPDDRTLIVRTGPKYFRIDLKSTCTNLLTGNDARLVTSGSPGLQQRMCGDLGEKVVTRDGLPCAVDTVTPINAETFKSLEKAAIEASRNRRGN